MRKDHLWLGTLLAGCRDPEPAAELPAPAPQSSETSPTLPADPVLDPVFRIDLSQLDVIFELTPGQSLDGSATLRFRMRPGQHKPLFHFDPWGVEGDALSVVSALSLDGEALDPASEQDIVQIEFEGSRQEALELQRELGPGEHTLQVSWSLPGGFQPLYPGWFHTNVDDTVGRGNESLWPTINSPEELARHTLSLRVHDPRPYAMIGSGAVTSRSEAGAQIFELDTGREISSYTLMLAAMPRDEVLWEEFSAGEVPVTLVSTVDADKTARMVERTTEVLAALQQDFGPFPMPFLQILLVDWPDGMEYYGATTTGASSLAHELVHMYWGCSAVNRTWRDTWWDEAVNVWWENRQVLPALPEGFHSDIVGGRSEIQTGFDGRAYEEGAVLVGELAERLGGDEAMLAFLADLHARRAFAPFTTDDLLDDLVLATGSEELRADFARWLYTP